MIVPNHLENQSLQPLPLMLIFSTAWQWVHHLQHVSTFAITPQLTGTLRNKQLWKLQHMDLSLWQPRQPQNRSWTLGTH